MTAALELPPWAIVTAERAEHIARVAALTQDWATGRGVSERDAARWRRAAILHDALRDAGPDDLMRYAPRGDWPVKLWHGPAAAEAARAHGETDQSVLNAVRYHSVGFAGWDDCGRVLFLADYLEPGREHQREHNAALAARVVDDLVGVLRDVTAARLRHLIDTGKPIRRETWELWNSLRARDS